MADQTEAARLHALRQLDLLDSDPSESFDRITRMAGQLFSLNTAAISLTDSDRQWFMSRLGVTDNSLPRHDAPCNEVTQERQQLVLADLLADPFYRTSTLAGTGARFYAGTPLTTRDGHCLGALCVVGDVPRQATGEEMASLRDLAAMVMSQIELRHSYGRIDPASGLPNRNQFMEDLQDLASERPGEEWIVALIDLAKSDELDGILRTMGPAQIDVLVQHAVRLLFTVLPADSPAYHVAATQIAFLLPNRSRELLDELGPVMTAHHVGADLAPATTPSLGARPFTVGSVHPKDVLRNACSAAQDARANECFAGVYSRTSDQRHERQYQLLHGFGTALQRESDLRLVYQPRIELTSGRCIGVEALLRWRHAELGEVSPSEFVPIVEQSSLMRDATAWVLDRAFAQQALWRAQGVRMCMSINVSASNLREGDFTHRVRTLLGEYGLAPNSIELEITESAIMDRSGAAQAQLLALDAAGISLAIDDFGTGYSSLSYLQRLPAKVVKIDQSFVRTLATGTREHALVRSIITLAHDLDYCVVAEGVETLAALQPLLAMGCDQAQGYFFSRPLEVADVDPWIRSRSDNTMKAAA